MNLDLSGRAALVTGGANGVGREIALGLAAAGASVAVNYRSSEADAHVAAKQIEALGQRTLLCRADIGDYEAARAMVELTAKELGGLDILVNNAGLAIRQRFTESKPEDWKKQIDTCLYGAIHCCHAAAPHLEASKRGRIISLVGDSSRIGESGLSIVGAARAGVIGLMKSLARELGRAGTTANALSLGLVETAHDRAWVEANREKLIKLYPLRRLGQACDVSPMVTLLASDAGSWITGQVISISGGFSMV
jgi:NAD(P)-dependent dehydrogenase (short-subunit alcohol dehydrogenase family)